MENLSDIQLLELMQNGDQPAFAVIARRYQVQLYRQIYKRIGSKEDTEDLLQNIYISLWSNRQTIKITDTLAPYLTKAAQYSVVNEYLFRKKRSGLENFLFALEEPVQQSVEDGLMAAELERAFERQLQKMPATIQEVFRLSRHEGLSVREIALKLGLNEQTVRNYISTALASLKRYIKNDNLSFMLSVATACYFCQA